jgi:hypothetical protein
MSESILFDIIKSIKLISYISFWEENLPDVEKR